MVVAAVVVMIAVVVMTMVVVVTILIVLTMVVIAVIAVIAVVVTMAVIPRDCDGCDSHGGRHFHRGHRKECSKAGSVGWKRGREAWGTGFDQ